MSHKFLMISLLAAGLGAALLSGCTNVARFDYNRAPGTMLAAEPGAWAQKSVAVMPFIDRRGNNCISESGGTVPAGDFANTGSFYWGFFPLVPFTTVSSEQPEAGEMFVSLGRFHFNPPDDLAAAAAQSLKASRLFGAVKRSGRNAAADTDYIFQGYLDRSRYEGTMIPYCVSYFLSPALWLLGAPEGVSGNELEVEFVLSDRATGEELWRYRYRGEDSTVQWLYARVGSDADKFAMLMKQAMNGAVYDLGQRER